MKKTIIYLLIVLLGVKANSQIKPVNITKPSVMIASPAEQTITIDPGVIGPFCPTKLVAGDRDFAGRGPEIWASVEITFNYNAVIATLKMRAKELPGGDNSETNSATLRILYTVPRGYQIVDVIGGKKSEVHFISKSAVTNFTPGTLARTLNTNVSSAITDKNDGLVKNWQIYGDTNGPDISDDNSCDDDTRMLVTLNKLNVKIRKTEVAQGIKTIQPEAITEWLVPKSLVRGDREFDGHGPRIKSEVKLRISPDGSQLLADVSFWAQETVSDFSTTEGNWTKVVYNAPYGKKITEIVSDKASRTEYLCPAAGFQFLVPGADVAKGLNTILEGARIQSAVLAMHGIPTPDNNAISKLIKGSIDHGNTVLQIPALEGTLVKFFFIVGDTGGPDISDDDNGNDDTRIEKIEFFPVKVKMVDAN